MNKLLFPQEVEVWYIIPSIRRELALELVKIGMNQKQAAEALGVTTAAISQYKSEKRGSSKKFNEKINREIHESAIKIKAKKSTVFHEIMKISRMVKDQGILCKIHKEMGNSHENCEKSCRNFYLNQNSCIINEKAAKMSKVKC